MALSQHRVKRRVSLGYGGGDLVGGDVSGAVRDLLEDGPEQPWLELGFGFGFGFGFGLGGG